MEAGIQEIKYIREKCVKPMPQFKNLHKFIDFLRKRGEAIDINDKISTELEVTALADYSLKRGGPALILHNVYSENGESKYPMLVNLFGTAKRIAYALGLEDESQIREFGELLAFLKHPTPPEGLRDLLGKIPSVKGLLSMKPSIVKKGDCQACVYEGSKVNLDDLPIQTCWPNEAAPLITWPLVVTQSFDTKKYNVGIYRMQKLGRDKLIVRWLNHRGGADHYRSWKEAGHKRMPIAAVIGCDPHTILSAVMPIPEDQSEYEFSGLLRKSKLELVKCKTQPLMVPVSAEVVIEGYVDLEQNHPEGPYGDHTGYYNSVEDFPVVQVTAITTRKDPYYLSTYTGRPPDEPSVLGEALNELFVPILKRMVPEVIDFYLPPEACSYRIGVVKIKKSYAGQGKKVMMAIWSALRQFMYTKFVIVVDGNINIRDWKDVMWAVSTKMDFERDVLTIPNTPIDYLDFASNLSGLGAKIGFDATDKIPPETTREWGVELNMPDEVTENIKKRFAKYFK